jgi:hypothetical protein
MRRQLRRPLLPDRRRGRGRRRRGRGRRPEEEAWTTAGGGGDGSLTLNLEAAAAWIVGGAAWIGGADDGRRRMLGRPGSAARTTAGGGGDGGLYRRRRGLDLRRGQRPEEEAREAWISGGAAWIGGGAALAGGADHGRRRRRGRKEMGSGDLWFGVAGLLGGASGWAEGRSAWGARLVGWAEGRKRRQIHVRPEKVGTSFCLHFVLFSSRENSPMNLLKTNMNLGTIMS